MTNATTVFTKIGSNYARLTRVSANQIRREISLSWMQSVTRGRKFFNRKLTDQFSVLTHDCHVISVTLTLNFSRIDDRPVARNASKPHYSH